MPAMAKPTSRAVKAAAAPKTKPSSSKPKAASAGSSHPPYFEMIKEAIAALKDRTGSSPVAIAKYMEEKYGASLPANYKKMLSIQLRGFASKGKLVRVKASYKLSDGAKESPKAKAKSVAPKVAPKPTKAAAKPKKEVAKPKAGGGGGTKRKAPEKKKPIAKAKKSPASKAKAKPKTIRSPAGKKARKIATA